MKIVSGSIAFQNPKETKTKSDLPQAIWAPECHLCMQPIRNPEQSRIGCLNNFCKLTCHIICLANHLLSSDPLQNGHYIPIAGECPLCETALLWVDLLQRKRKMQGILTEEDDGDSEESDDESCNNDFNTSFPEFSGNIDDEIGGCKLNLLPTNPAICELSD